MDNDLLWYALGTNYNGCVLMAFICSRFAILGLTYNYINSKIPRAVYETYQGIYHDEVSRLSPQAAQNDVFHSFLSINPDDISVRSTEELRFMLCRHWTLYDAMLHSSYVAGKLGIWKEKGRSRLTGLLAKMGCVITVFAGTVLDMSIKFTQFIHKSGTTAIFTYGYGLEENSNSKTR